MLCCSDVNEALELLITYELSVDITDLLIWLAVFVLESSGYALQHET